jgi:soluble lytic murein transglycosylase-like protein
MAIPKGVIWGGLALLGLYLLTTTMKSYSKTVQTIQTNYSSLISYLSVKYGIPVAVITGQIAVESAGNTQAVGSSGERGLLQVMPDALTDVNQRYGLGYSFDDLFTPEYGMEAGVAYLKIQLDAFGDIRDALRAYNAGPGNARKYSNAGSGYADKVLSASNQVAV